ncbi:hypothetical protein ACLOJK_024817 [Asimina triloba]
MLILTVCVDSHARAASTSSSQRNSVQAVRTARWKFCKKNKIWNITSSKGGKGETCDDCGHAKRSTRITPCISKAYSLLRRLPAFPCSSLKIHSTHPCAAALHRQK